MKDRSVFQSATLTDVAMCVNHYRLSTPGLFVCVHVGVALDDGFRVVPGLVAQVNSGRFKQCELGRGECFQGAPNFVFDVFGVDERDVYEERRGRFEQAGGIEYVAWFDEAPRPVWNRRVDGRFVEVSDDGGGMIKSAALPGLWVPLVALEERDWWGVMARISQGVTRRGHRDFMATIWKN